MLASAAICDAAPAKEPVILTEQSDSEVALADGIAGPLSVDDRIRTFSQAISQSAATERQEMAARCKSLRAIPADGASREAWEANCRYQRR